MSKDDILTIVPFTPNCITIEDCAEGYCYTGHVTAVTLVESLRFSRRTQFCHLCVECDWLVKQEGFPLDDNWIDVQTLLIKLWLPLLSRRPITKACTVTWQYAFGTTEITLMYKPETSIIKPKCHSQEVA